MPPFTSQEHHYGPVDLDLDHDLSFVDISLDSKPVRERTMETSNVSVIPVEDEDEVSSTDSDSSEEEDNDSKGSEKSVIEKMLDFNPCMIKVKNPSSALFKKRTCAECGCNVHKLKGGYKKEIKVETIVDEVTNIESEIETKIYFRPQCAERRQHRVEHREAGFGNVLTEIVEFFEAKARKKLEEQARLVRLAREAEDDALVAQASVRAPTTKKSFLKMGFASSFAKKTKKALKSFSFNACRGKQDSTIASAHRGEGVLLEGMFIERI